MKKIISLIFILSCSFLIVGCQDNDEVQSISIQESTVPTDVKLEDIDTIYSLIKIDVTRNDGTVENISLSKDMITNEDLDKLSTVGTHIINVNYEGKAASFEINVLENKDVYIITVLYPDGNPVVGVRVQMCNVKDKVCYMNMATTNDKGVARSTYGPEDGECIVHVLSIPSGFSYDSNAYIVNSENREITITLIPSSDLVGEGTKEIPYVVNANTVYTLSYGSRDSEEKGMKYHKVFSFTATESKTYHIRSIADTFTLPCVDPYFGYIGEDISQNPSGAVGNEDQYNFDFELNAEANKTYYFIVFVSDAPSWPAKFDIVID